MLSWVKGASAARAAYGVNPTPDTGSAPKDKKKKPWWPALTAAGVLGAGAGLLAYRRARTPTFSKDPRFADIQRKAYAEGLHQIRNVVPPGTPGTNARAIEGEAGKPLSLMNRFKGWLLDGSAFLPSTHPLPQKGVFVGAGAIDGVPRHPSPDVLDLRDATSVASDATRTFRIREEGGKSVEARWMQENGMGHLIPTTYADFRTMAAEKTPSAPNQWRDFLAARVKADGGTEFVLKPSHGVASSGKFPTEKDDWDALLARFSEAKNAPNSPFSRLNSTNIDNETVTLLKEKGLHEGWVIDTLMRSPRHVFAQHRVMNPGREHRVHVERGMVPSELVMSRHPGDWATSLFAQKEREELADWVRKEFIPRLPEYQREANFALDVLPHQGADGKRSFKILELNPRDFNSASGLQDPAYHPLAGHLWHRAFTGRHTEPAAAALAAVPALGVAGLTLGAGRALTPARDTEEEGAPRDPRRPSVR